MFMVRLALGVLLCTALLAAPAPASACGRNPNQSAQEVLDCVQRRYDKSETFVAGFEQNYWSQAFNKRRISRGTIRFKRPARYSWRYDDGRSIVSDGTNVVVRDRDGAVIAKTGFLDTGFTWALSFMMKDELRRRLLYRKLDANRFQYTAGFVLEGVPKQSAAPFDKLLQYIAYDHKVERAWMIEATGTKNRITFVDEALFVDIPDAEFDPEPAPREPTPLP